MRGIKVKSSNNYYFAVAGMTLTLLAGCGASTQSAPAVTVTVTAPVEEPAVVASTEPETAVDSSANDSSSSNTSSATGQGGSIGTAVALGTSLTLDKWKVSVVRFTENATNAVLNENQFNDKPGAGQSYSLIRVRATYLGSGSESADFELRVAFVGSDNREYKDTDCRAVEPDALSDQPDVRKGGTVTGNFCIKAPTKVVKGPGAVVVRTSGFGDESEGWWNKP